MTQTVTWYIVFFDKMESNWWIGPLLHKNFKHCECFRDISPHVLYHEPTGFNINTKVLVNKRAEDHAEELVKQGLRVLRYKVVTETMRRSSHVSNYIPNCVTIVKQIIGVVNFGVTPYKFYKWLLKNGARRV